jgi:hypothetical protein
VKFEVKNFKKSIYNQKSDCRKISKNLDRLWIRLELYLRKVKRHNLSMNQYSIPILIQRFNKKQKKQVDNLNC